jgi:signal transduction histidine kinase
VAGRARETAERRRHRGPSREEREALANALLRFVARSLDLERVAILIEERPGHDLVPVATVGNGDVPSVHPGAVPGGGPWSLTVPLVSEGRTAGLLLLARSGGRPLSPADRRLAERLGEAAARLVEHTRMAADLVHSRELIARADRLAALGTLAASLAHEIRNPLVSVRTFIQLLPERLADEEFRTTFRDLALGEVERICGLLNDILAFARPAPAELDPADLNEVVGQITRLLEAEARRQDVDLTCDLDPALPVVVAHEGQVKQVLMNIILNAIQACPPHGQVAITTRADASWCEVAVADSGPGIPPDDLEHIFDPFFSTKEAGSGLGLFVAHQIVTQHGGRIVPSPRDGGGTVFSIRLPVRGRSQDADASAG